MKNIKKKLYVGCAINNLPKEIKEHFLKQISDLKDSLRNDFDVMDFIGIADGDPKLIYDHDIINCVGNADCMLAICDYPSTGLGYEIATAVEKRGIPVLAVAQKNSSVTRLVIGINKKDFLFERYESLLEVKDMVIKVLK